MSDPPKFSTNKSEWWDYTCQEAVRERRRAKRKFKKHPENEHLKSLYGEKSIDAEIVINRVRNLYYDKKLSSLKGDSRGTYKVINHLLDKEYSGSKLPNGDNDGAIAEDLKNFFDEKVKTIFQNRG